MQKKWLSLSELLYMTGRVGAGDRRDQGYLRQVDIPSLAHDHGRGWHIFICVSGDSDDTRGCDMN